jgi:hypothetical protein
MIGESKGEGLIFNDKIKRNTKILFDRQKRILIDEKTGKKISKFFLPKNVPAVAAVTDKEYKTMNLIQDFISRMLFLEANRFAADQIVIDKNAMILDGKGANVGCVLNNWQQKKPHLFREVIDAFKDCYSFIEDVYIKEEPLGPGAPVSPLLYMKEKDVVKDISQRDWSDGLLRTLCHFVLACTQFQNEEKDVIRPSLIGIDEVENGLDFKTIEKVIHHYIEYSNLIQTALATHSPLVCNMIETFNWLVMRRKGATVQLFLPSEVEDIEAERLKLKKDNWEFYRRHVSQSKIYRIA